MVLVLGVAGCGARTSASRQTARPAPTLGSVLGCLERAGADATALTVDRDLRVSGGELAVSFVSFHAYVGLAADRREAVAAANVLDQQITVLGQAGHGVVRGAVVYYFDAPLVPRAGARLVEACMSGLDLRAANAMAALAQALPVVQYPAELRQRAVGRCRAVSSAASCDCVYARAARLFSYAQIDGLGRAWTPRRALSVIAGLLGTCTATRPAARL